MSKETLSSVLVNLTIESIKEKMDMIDSIIKAINNKMSVCANNGYTSIVIQFTRNENFKSEKGELSSSNEYNSSRYSLVIHAANDIIKRKYTEYIKDYYEKRMFDVSNRHNNDDTLVISWNKNVLNHYGYEF